MRKSKIIKIDDQEIAIKELRVRDVYYLLGLDEKEPLFDRLDNILSRCSDLNRDKIFDMTPSELEIVWEGFREVNASFLDVAANLGFKADLLQDLTKSILLEQLTGSSPLDTAE